MNAPDRTPHGGDIPINADDATVYKWQITCVPEIDEELSRRQPGERPIYAIIFVISTVVACTSGVWLLLIAPLGLFVGLEMLIGHSVVLALSVVAVGMAPLAVWTTIRRIRGGKTSAHELREGLLLLWLPLVSLEYIIVRDSFVSAGFTGSTHSLWQWCLFFLNQLLNLVFLGIPQYALPSLTNITPADWQARAVTVIFRLMLTYSLIDSVLRYFWSHFRRGSVFYGTTENAGLYLQYTYPSYDEREITISRLGMFTQDENPSFATARSFVKQCEKVYGDHGRDSLLGRLFRWRGRQILTAALRLTGKKTAEIEEGMARLREEDPELFHRMAGGAHAGKRHMRKRQP